jgi:AcrR family transcriptional regulator
VQEEAASNSNSTRRERLRQNSQERRERERGALRQSILDAAAGLFAADGYEAFSLRQVAESIGYSATSIYLHFKDKDELLLHVVLEGFRGFGEALQAGYLSTDDPQERIHAIGRAYLRFGLDHPLHYRVMFMQNREMLAKKTLAGKESVIDSFAILKKAVIEAMQAGAIEVGDPNAASALFWSGVHGIVSLTVALGQLTNSQAEQLFEWQIRLFTAGLRPKPQP